MNTAFIPLMLFAPVLIYSGISDLQRMRIPNWASIAAVVLFLLTLPLVGFPEAGWRLFAAASVFVVGLALWALRMFGAGDVKLVSAVLLLVPISELHTFSQVFSISLLVGLALVTGLRRSGVLRHTGWVSMRAAGQFPMGISIALAGVALPFASPIF